MNEFQAAMGLCNLRHVDADIAKRKVLTERYRERLGGVDPAARDYILHTIISNYSKDATVILSTHLIGDIEPVLDEAIFLKDGRVFAHRSVEELRETEGMSVDAYFREVFKC